MTKIYSQCGARKKARNQVIKEKADKPETVDIQKVEAREEDKKLKRAINQD